MGMFEKLFGGKKQKRPPSWAGYLKDFDQYEKFVLQVFNFIQAQGYDVTLDQIHSGTAFLRELNGKKWEWHLNEVATQCANAEPASWPALLKKNYYDCKKINGASREEPFYGDGGESYYETDEDTEEEQKQNPTDGDQEQIQRGSFRFEYDPHSNIPRIISGKTEIAFNQPVFSREDVGPWLTDPVEIATRILFQYRLRAIEAYPEITFIEATWFLHKVGKALPVIENAERQALTQLIKCAVQNDPEAAFSFLKNQYTQSLSDLQRITFAQLTTYTDSLFARRWPIQTANFLRESKFPPGLILMESLAPRDPELCERLFENVDSPYLLQKVVLEALLSAMRLGQPVGILEKRWLSLGESEENEELHLEWLDGEIQRMSQLDLQRATAIRRNLIEVREESIDAAEAYFCGLAQVDPKQALELAISAQRSGTDDLPKIIGCQKGGIDVSSVTDQYIESLDPYSYHPYHYYKLLVELCFLMKDAKRLKKTFEQAGPKGWQIVHVVRYRLRDLLAEQSTMFPQMFELCLSSYSPRVIAGRDGSDGGIHAGHVSIRPPWLQISGIKPLETLVLVKELGEDAPDWFPLRRKKK